MKLRQLVVVTLLAAGTTAVVAQQFKPEDQIRYRQSSMNVIGRSFGALNGMSQGNVPFSKDVATKHAETVANLAAWVGTAYGPGTDKGAPTRADAKIWTEGDKFKAAYDKFVAETAKLPAAAADVGTLKTQVAEVAKTCKSCHDDYRQREFRN